MKVAWVLGISLGAAACGTSLDAESKRSGEAVAEDEGAEIRNGEQAAASYAPEVGMLLRISNRGDVVGVCTATLIRPNAILTAAHCSGKNDQPATELYFTQESLRGSGRFLSPSGLVRVTSFDAHPRYGGFVAQDAFDIAVARLERPITVSRYAELASDADLSALKQGAQLELIGFGNGGFRKADGSIDNERGTGVKKGGMQSFDGVVSGAELTCAELAPPPTVGPRACQMLAVETHAGALVRYTRGSSGQISCSGDSGAASILKVGDARKIVSIVNGGTSEDGSALCESSLDSYEASVGFHRAWIEERAQAATLVATAMVTPANPLAEAGKCTEIKVTFVASESDTRAAPLLDGLSFAIAETEGRPILYDSKTCNGQAASQLQRSAARDSRQFSFYVKSPETLPFVVRVAAAQGSLPELVVSGNRAGEPSRLVVAAPPSAKVTQCFPVDVEVQDAFGHAAASESDELLTLNAGLLLFGDVECSTSLRKPIALPKGSSNLKLFAMSDWAGPVDVIASVASGRLATSMSKRVVLEPGEAAELAVRLYSRVPTSSTKATCHAVDVVIEDAHMNPVKASADIVVRLASSKAGGFYVSNGKTTCGSKISQMRIKAGTGGRRIYFLRNPKAPRDVPLTISDASGRLRPAQYYP